MCRKTNLKIQTTRLLEDPDVTKKFPTDAVERAKIYLEKAFKGGIGAYTDSRGALHVRNEIAEFIQRRDGQDLPDGDNIFITNGAGAAVFFWPLPLVPRHRPASPKPEWDGQYS